MKEQTKQENRVMPHVISLSERESLSVSGVQDVDSFDETAVVVYTSLGELTVRGSGLHISRLNTETGDLLLDGQVESMVYADTHARNGGFFTKLFR